MKKMICGLAAIAAASLVSGAFASDLPSRRAAPAPAPYLSPAPVFSWTGFYAGINGGYGFGSFDTSRGKKFLGSVNGGLIGGTVGYNYQFSQFVAGLEGDFDYASIDNTKHPFAGATTKSKLSSIGTIRGRLGFAADRALVFVTGGFAGGQVKARISDSVNNVFQSRSDFRSGYALGAGIEYAFTNNISAKAEYIYTSLGSRKYFSAPDNIDTGLHTSMVRAGLNYRF